MSCRWVFLSAATAMTGIAISQIWIPRETQFQFVIVAGLATGIPTGIASGICLRQVVRAASLAFSTIFLGTATGDMAVFLLQSASIVMSGYDWAAAGIVSAFQGFILGTAAGMCAVFTSVGLNLARSRASRRSQRL